ncbi:MAG: hypothetical protein WAT93_07330 [Pontixanthobacter sp.]
MVTILSALALLQTASTIPPNVPSAPPVPPPSCQGPGYDDFDFWVGEWDVYPNGSAVKVADSTIERLYNGCAIRESWMPLKGGTGGSLNSYDASTARWHQTWVGSSPGRVEFMGGRAGDGIALTGYWNDIGGPGRHGLVQMVYTPHPDGSVSQFGRVSYDHGLNWQTSFDFIYRPKQKVTP